VPAKLRNGVIGAPGGYRNNSGRKPDEFKKWIKGLVHSKEARKRFEGLIKDLGDVEDRITEKGDVIPGRAKADTYLRALELGLNYAEGKPVAETKTDQKQHEDIIAAVLGLRGQRSLPSEPQ